MPRTLATTRRAAISGDIVIAKVSGETVITDISGQWVVAKTSGEIQFVITRSGDYVVISGDVVAKVSGEVVKISGETVIAKVSGETVVSKVSGEIVDIKVPTSVTSGGIFVVGSQSGGVILTSGPCISATIKSMSGNSGDIYIAGQALQSGEGFVLEPGEAINLDIDNFGRVHLLASVSGDRVTFVGVL